MLLFSIPELSNVLPKLFVEKLSLENKTTGKNHSLINYDISGVGQSARLSGTFSPDHD